MLFGAVQLADGVVDSVHTQPPANISMIEPMAVHAGKPYVRGYGDVDMIDGHLVMDFD